MSYLYEHTYETIVFENEQLLKENIKLRAVAEAAVKHVLQCEKAYARAMWAGGETLIMPDELEDSLIAAGCLPLKPKDGPNLD